MGRFVRIGWVAWLVLGSSIAQSESRPMVVDDLFTLSELGDVALSPDGAWIAATVTRPGVANACPTCNYKATGDVWLLDRRTGDRVNLTNGAADGSSSWMPVWAPDGRRLAFVSTRPERTEPRGGDNIRLYVCDVATRTLRRLNDRGVWLQVEARTGASSAQPVAWLSETTLLAVLLQPGVAADQQILYWKRGMAEAQRAWARWAEGTEPTASVLESGAPAAELPTASLARIEVASGKIVLLAEIPKWDLWDLSLSLQVVLSRDATKAAVLAIAGTMPPDADRPVSDSIRTYRAGAVGLEAPGPVRWASLDQKRAHVDGSLHGWSVDGRQFLLSEAAEPGLPGGRRLMIAVPADGGGTRDVTPPGMTVAAGLWTSDGVPLVRARPIAGAATDGKPARWDWWRLEPGKAPIAVTASMSAAPGVLLDDLGTAERFVGISGGAVWSVDGIRDAAVRMTSVALPAGASIVRRPPGRVPSRGGLDLLASADAGGVERLFHVASHGAADPREASVRPIASPSATAAWLDGDPGAGGLVFRDDTSEGIVLWATEGSGERPVRCLSLNAHVAKIAEGRRMLVSYRGANGDDLHGLAILPPGFEPGKRHPVVTWVYGGLRIRDAQTPLASKLSTRPLNLELMAGHGYVVLIPSVPLPAFGTKDDPWLEIPKGVLPCVDKLVDLGIADPDRLAVAGHSTGGYSTYAVVTYTNRFKAAVALSGHPDLVSLHGQFYPGERYNARAHEGLATLAFVESVPLGLGGPPWKDLGRYVRNTPLFWFDRVKTPLMIVHGDMDGAPIQQGEEAFMNLWRQGKRARFVRYWGEGHVIGSPPNVRHLWAQIFDWLDGHLRK